MFEDHHGRVKCQRTAEPDACQAGRPQLPHRAIERGLRKSHSFRELDGALPDVIGRRLDLERVRHGEVLHHGQPIEQHGARADDPETIDDGKPVGAVCDRGRRSAEQSDLAAVRQGGTGHEIHEHLRRRLIEPDDRDVFTGAHLERRDPERAQAPVVL
jgi:hypothetical protein